MPLIKLEGVLSDVGTEGSGGVTVSPIALRELSLVIDTVGLHEALHVAPRLVESVTHLINEREVTSLGDGILDQNVV